MTDSLLNILKIVFLVLLYLFFIRVIWVVSSEVRAGRPRGPAPGPAPVAAPLAPFDDRRLGAPLDVMPGATGVGAAPPHQAPVGARARKGRKGDVGRLVVIEPKERRGTTFALGAEITMGRAAGCVVQIVDDSYISSLHTRVFHDAAGEAMVEDLGSTNGTFLNGERLVRPQGIRPGDRIQLGNTILEAQ
jgi:hypothetical protein